MIRRFAILLAALTAFAIPRWATAQVYTTSPIGNLRDHLSITASAGWLGFSPGTGSRWNGADAAVEGGFNDGAITLVAAFDHGFPLNGSDGQKNLARLYANLKVAPNGPGGLWQLFIGAGGLWAGNATVKDWRGGEAHFTGSRYLTGPLALAGTYIHGFSSASDQADIDIFRIALVGRIFP